MKKRIIDTRAGNLSIWESAGSTGPIVFLCHSNSTSAAAFEPLLSGAVGRRRRLVAIEFPGHGGSPNSSHPDRDYSILGLGRFVGAVIAELGVDRYVLCGHSLGGHVLTEAMPDLPGARGLFLISAPPIDREALGWIFRPDPTGGCLFAAELSEAQTQHFADCLVDKERVGNDRRTVIAREIARTDASFRPALGASLGRGEFRSEIEILRSTSIPVAISTGLDDAFIDPACYARFTIPSLWRGDYQRFEGAGHSPHLESPEEFERVFEHFLADVSE